MSESKYEKIVKTGYAMLKMRKPPSGFFDVHLTISVDEDKKSALDEVWRLPHFTLVEMDWMGSSSETHVYIREKQGGFDLVNKSGTVVYDPKNVYLPLCQSMLKDSQVSGALREPERFVLYGL